jgi:hypothetical protein
MACELCSQFSTISCPSQKREWKLSWSEKSQSVCQNTMTKAWGLILLELDEFKKTIKSVCENFNIPFKHFSLHNFFKSTFDIHCEFYEHLPIIVDDQCPLQLQQLKDKLDIERLLFISNQ